MKVETRRQFTKEFKARAVELAGLGRPVTELAAELGIGSSMYYRWIQQGRGDSQVGSGGAGAVGVGPGADELRILRREIAQLKLENDILKKAAVILGTQPQLGSGR